MLISFIIPVYNAEQYIEKCIANIKNINKFNYEIIFVDDGSSDNTLKILERFKNVGSIKIIRNKHKGVSHSRNCGLRAAEGKFVFFADVDDVILEGINNIDEKKITDNEVVFLGYKVINNSKEKTYCVKDNYKKWNREDLLFFYDNLLKGETDDYSKRIVNGYVYQYLLEKDFLINNGLTFHEDMPYKEDLIFTCDILNKAHNVASCNDICYEHIVYDNSASHRYRENCWEELKTVHSRLNCNTELKKEILANYLIISIYHYTKKSGYSESIRTINNISNDSLVLENIKDILILKSMTKKRRLIMYLLKVKKISLIYLLCKI